MKHVLEKLRPHSTTAPRLGTALLAAATLAAAAPAASAAQDAPRSYVRAGPGGATVRNLGDRSGHPILRVDPGGLLAVHDQRGDWLEVEAPGGFEVWVFGKYVSETNVPGILQVSGNHVNMRPKPSSDVDSFPLPRRLFSGDRVVLLSRARASATWDDDWIQIASPPGVRAWVLASETEPVPPGEGAGAWKAAVEEARERPAPAPVDSGSRQGSGGGAPDASSKGGEQAAAAAVAAEDMQQAVQALRSADELFSAERLKTQPDLEKVRAAYEEVLAITATGATADLARSGMARVQALGEARELQAALEAERVRRDTEAERYRRELEEARKRTNDPYSGRFSYRGWLERQPSQGKAAPTYVVRFGGREIVELVCSSGRYDLDDFSGFELGVRGALLREGVTVPDGQAGGVLPSIDVGRIEVLAGRSR